MMLTLGKKLVSEEYENSIFNEEGRLIDGFEYHEKIVPIDGYLIPSVVSCGIDIDLHFRTKDFKGVTLRIMCKKYGYRNENDWHSVKTIYIPGFECDGYYYHKYKNRFMHNVISCPNVYRDITKFEIDKKGICERVCPDRNEIVEFIELDKK